MAFMDDVLGRVVDAVGTVARAALIPWGGAEACVDAYETAIRAVTDAQLTSLARSRSSRCDRSSHRAPR